MHHVRNVSGVFGKCFAAVFGLYSTIGDLEFEFFQLGGVRKVVYRVYPGIKSAEMNRSRRVDISRYFYFFLVPSDLGYLEVGKKRSFFPKNVTSGRGSFKFADRDARNLFGIVQPTPTEVHRS